MSDPSAPIVLARSAAFALGRLTVRPATREVIRDDGEVEVLEPRVMQVLVALHRAGGGIVARDDLTQSCWEGRVVGEDAINRVVSRLRRTAAAIGEGVFRVETVTKVGYRLVDEGGGAAAPPADMLAPSAAAVTRRRAVGGLAAATAVIGLGAIAWSLREPPAPANPVQPLLDQAWTAWTQGTNEGSLQAIGLYRRATERAPDVADAWGLLACAHADRAQGWTGPAEQRVLRQRAIEAGQQALRLDPRNAYGRAAIAYARPVRGNWALMESAFLRSMRDQPGKWLVPYSLALLYTRVGRLTEAAALFEQLRGNAPTVTQFQFHIAALWGAGRLGEAERLLDEALVIYRSHRRIWWLHFDMLLAGARPAAAIALAQDRAGRPGGLADDVVDRRTGVARAVMSRAPDDIAVAAAAALRLAREAASPASYALQDLALLGRTDDAFAVADAYFFSRGFAIPDVPVASGETATVTLDARQTAFLFLPFCKDLRADPRFGRLVEELGLGRYWREAGRSPTYRGEPRV